MAGFVIEGLEDALRKMDEMTKNVAKKHIKKALRAASKPILKSAKERFYVMGGSSIQNATAIVSEDFTGKINVQNKTLRCTNPCTVTITGTDIKLEDIKKIKFTLDTTPIYIYISSAGKSWEQVSVGKDKIVLQSKAGYYYQVSRVIQGDEGQSITLKGTTENIT